GADQSARRGSNHHSPSASTSATAARAWLSESERPRHRSSSVRFLEIPHVQCFGSSIMSRENLEASRSASCQKLFRWHARYPISLEEVWPLSGEPGHHGENTRKQRTADRSLSVTKTAAWKYPERGEVRCS